MNAPYDWSKADWSKSDYALAREAGVSHTTAWRRRRQAAAGELPQDAERRYWRDKFIKRQRELGFACTDIGKRLRARGYSITDGHVGRIARKLGVNGAPVLLHKNWKVNWDEVDWSKHPEQIAKELGVSRSNVYRMKGRFKMMGFIKEETNEQDE